MPSIIICFVFVLGGSIVFSFPTSYALDFFLSQAHGCAVRIENPLVRTGLGAVGGSAGSAGLIGGVVAKAVELSVPSTAKVFHGPRCN
jgi:hypothetical protein